MNFLDLVIIGGLLFGGLAGYRKGLISSLIAVLATIISLVLAFSNYKSLAPVLNTQFGLGKVIHGIIMDTMSLPVSKTQTLGSGNPLDKITLLTNTLPNGIQKVFNQIFQETLQSAIGTSLKTVGDVIAQYFTLVILGMLAFLIIFIVSNFVVRFIGNTLTRNFGKNIFGAINNSGGFIAGGLSAALLICIITGFMVPLLALYSPTLVRLVHNSLLTNIFLNGFVALNNFLGL